MFHADNVNVQNVNFNGYLNNGIYGSYVINNVTFGNPTYVPGGNYLFNNYDFNGDMNYGIHFDNSHYLSLGFFTGTSSNQNRFVGTINNYCTHIVNCGSVTQYGNIFHTNTFASPSTASGTLDYGVYYENVDTPQVLNCIFQSVLFSSKFEDCKNSLIESNNFLGSASYGIEMYGVACNGYPNVISSNRFVGNTNSLVISPEINPIGATNLDNQIATQMDIDITCNYFNANYYTIVGSGNIQNQGNGTTTNGNKFVSNVEWDLIWDDYDNSYARWDWKTPTTSTPNANLSLTKSNIILNGTTFTSSSTLEFTIPLVAVSNENSCFASLNKTNPYNGITQNSEEHLFIKNPVTNELILKGIEIKDDKIICFDELGKFYDLSLNSFSDNFFKFDTEKLAPGMYFITLGNQTLKFIKL